MPAALLLALAASLGLHVAALFGPDIDLTTEPEALPVMAEIRPMPAPLPPSRLKQNEKPAAAKAKGAAAGKKSPVQRTAPLLSVPDSGPVAEAADVQTAVGEAGTTVASKPEPEPEAVVLPPRLPERGEIRYRVDRGDSNFEIGSAHHRWSIVDDVYRIESVLETTGIVWLFKSVRIEMESRGLISSAGLRPDFFEIRRGGRTAKENAVFDWHTMKVSIGGRPEQSLATGAQDLLSFNYQLGYLPELMSGVNLPIATGKRYGVYRIEVLGDEEIEVPAGTLRTLHLRAPGENTTELWLAYDYLLLPVKIRHVDSKGDSLVQVATHIQLSPP